MLGDMLRLLPKSSVGIYSDAIKALMKENQERISAREPRKINFSVNVKINPVRVIYISSKGTETTLIVEDEDQLRSISSDILRTMLVQLSCSSEEFKRDIAKKLSDELNRRSGI